MRALLFGVLGLWFGMLVITPEPSLSTGTRSASARREFQRYYPCPSTHRNSGRCPGYVVDHVIPLACGGADRPSNMQWQIVKDAKAKDHTERRSCR